MSNDPDDLSESDKTATSRIVAASLARQIVRMYPPEIDRDPARRPSIARITRIVHDICIEAVKYRDRRKLGWIGRAHFSNEFRWALSEKGYTRLFIEFATEAIVVHLSRGSTEFRQ